jgi:hypothetical protein
MRPGTKLADNAQVGSCNGQYRLVVQASDGNVVLYDRGGAALWATNTASHPHAELIMQNDGNLVVYDAGRPIWSSGTFGHPGARLRVRDDGALVIYDESKPIWTAKGNR